MARLITRDVWRELTSAAQSTKKPAEIAVAYFAQSAGALLRLAPGSRLVVDASIAAVKSGLTHPDTLARLVGRGVRVYSLPRLHAKVFVLGNRAFVGSANVSASSAKHLVEAMLVTAEPEAVAAARRFVRDQCLERLSPEFLKELQRSYRPPQSGAGAKIRPGRTRVGTSPVRLVQLEVIEYPDDETGLELTGLERARLRREHRSGWEVQEFRVTGPCSIERGDIVVQVVHAGGPSPLVEPPGKVLHVQHRRTKRLAVAYVFVEVRKSRRRPTVRQLASELNGGAGRRLVRAGLVAKEFGAQLLTHLDRQD